MQYLLSCFYKRKKIYVDFLYVWQGENSKSSNSFFFVSSINLFPSCMYAVIFEETNKKN